MSKSTSASSAPLAQALQLSDTEQQQSALLDWLLQDRELLQARALISAHQLSGPQAALLYYWLYMIELAIASSPRHGRRWLDQDSHFRLQLAGVLLQLTRQYGQSCNAVYHWQRQAPLPLSPRGVSQMIHARERKTRHRRQQDSLAA